VHTFSLAKASPKKQSINVVKIITHEYSLAKMVSDIVKKEDI